MEPGRRIERGGMKTRHHIGASANQRRHLRQGPGATDRLQAPSLSPQRLHPRLRQLEECGIAVQHVRTEPHALGHLTEARADGSRMRGEGPG